MVDPVMSLHESSAVSFDTNGLGSLSSATYCNVISEVNGIYEMEMDYPIDGCRFDELRLRRIIFVKPDPYSNPQPFRIYSISTPINGIVNVKAAHISYDLSGVTVSPFEASSTTDFMARLNTGVPAGCPFKFQAESNVELPVVVAQPSSVRPLLGIGQGSMVDIYGGELGFDKFDVRWKPRLGSDRGVTVAYGKNLTDINQEENCGDVYTAIHPYWYSEETGVIELPEKIVKCVGDYNYVKAMPVDLSSYWEEMPSADMLRDAAKLYIEANGIGIPNVSIEVSFVTLSQTDEYQNYALLETVHLGDTVHVYFPKGKISAVSRCIKTTYDVLADRYISVELGNSTRTLEDVIVSQSTEISNLPTMGDVQQTVDNSSQLITGGFGGYVVIHSTTSTKKPDEILIMNTPDIKTAQNVWRWNKNGLGFSASGYNGPYKTAITSDGKIVADFITAGTLAGNIIQGGIIKDKKGKFLFNLDNGEVRLDQLSVLTNSVNEILENGVTKLKTGLGLNILNTAIEIFKQGDPSNLTNTLNESGMYVIRAKGTPDETTMLQADKNGVIATDLKARNYLIVSDCVRYEKTMVDGEYMAACFWIGG